MIHKKISVLIPSYNTEKYIEKAIKSMINQTVVPDEIIVVDDHSNDDSWSLILKLSKECQLIKPFRNEKNRGVAYTRNQLLKHSSGFYLVFLDGDDLSERDRIEKQVSFMEKNKDIDVCGSNFLLIDKEDKIIGEKKFPESDVLIKKNIWRCPFGNNTIIVKKECFDDLGFYDEDLLLAEDMDIWLRFYKKFNFYNIQENLVRYRIHGNNLVFKNRKKLYEYSIKVIKKAVLEYNYKMPLKAKIYFFIKKIAIIMPDDMLLFFSRFVNKLKVNK